MRDAAASCSSLLFTLLMPRAMPALDFLIQSPPFLQRRIFHLHVFCVSMRGAALKHLPYADISFFFIFIVITHLFSRTVNIFSFFVDFDARRAKTMPFLFFRHFAAYFEDAQCASLRLILNFPLFITDMPAGARER